LSIYRFNAFQGGVVLRRRKWPLCALRNISECHRIVLVVICFAIVATFLVVTNGNYWASAVTLLFLSMFITSLFAIILAKLKERTEAEVRDLSNVSSNIISLFAIILMALAHTLQFPEHMQVMENLWAFFADILFVLLVRWLSRMMFVLNYKRANE
jgi:hypothetical protein